MNYPGTCVADVEISAIRSQGLDVERNPVEGDPRALQYHRTQDQVQSKSNGSKIALGNRVRANVGLALTPRYCSFLATAKTNSTGGWASRLLSYARSYFPVCRVTHN